MPRSIADTSAVVSPWSRKFLCPESLRVARIPGVNLAMESRVALTMEVEQPNRLASGCTIG